MSVALALLWVSEGSGPPMVAGRDLALPPGATFPGAADPQGTHQLVVAVDEGPRGHRESLWLLPLTGEGGAELAAAGRIRHPVWSPDGSFVVFETDAYSYRDLARVDRAGGDPVRLTSAPHGSFEPALSPDGTQLAFGSSRDGNAEIYVMSAEGGPATRITTHPRDDVRPRWAPDGTLSWLSRRDGDARVWILAQEGPERLEVVGEGDHVDLVWAPQGRRLAVTVADAPGETSLRVVDLDGATRVLDGPGPDEHPAWSPDGTRLAFTSSRSGSPDIWVASPGGDLRRITVDPVAAWLPRWVPQPLQ